jgi:hypothetical protein
MEKTTMSDPTETIRRQQLAEINGASGSREALEEKHGQVWDTQELGRDFDVQGFMAPYVVVRRKSDGQRGSLLFQHPLGPEPIRSSHSLVVIWLCIGLDRT